MTTSARTLGELLVDAREAKGLTQEQVAAKLDTDRNQRTAAGLGVQGLPTLELFRDGQVVGRRTGLMQRPQLEQWLRELGALPSRAT